MNADKDCPGFTPTNVNMVLPRCVCGYCENSTMNQDGGGCDGDWEDFKTEADS